MDSTILGIKLLDRKHLNLVLCACVNVVMSMYVHVYVSGTSSQLGNSLYFESRARQA